MIDQRRLLVLVLVGLSVLALNACDSAKQPPVMESGNLNELKEPADSQSETSDGKREVPEGEPRLGPSEADLKKITLAAGKVLVVAHNHNDFVVELTVDGNYQGEVDANSWSTLGVEPGEHSFFARAKDGRGTGIRKTISSRWHWHIRIPF